MGLTKNSADYKEQRDSGYAPIEQVQDNDIVVVRPGEKIPVDGEIVGIFVC